MKSVIFIATCFAVASSFQLLSPTSNRKNAPLLAKTKGVLNDGDVSSRKVFLDTSAGAAAAAFLASQVVMPQPAMARGRATLEKSYQRYAPRIVEGGKFYGSDLRKLVERADWAGIKNALQDPPERKKGDLNKADAGVAERAKQAGGFSDARVVVAADLFAAAFSDSSISPKTRKMQAEVEKLREAVEGMKKTAKIALGEEKSGGLFGLGAKKPDTNALAKQLRDYYLAGGNAYNAYCYAANEDLAVQFDRLPYIGG